MAKTANLLALTGGTGFLGRRIGEIATARGWKIRALVRRSKRGPRPGLGFSAETVSGDLDDPAALKQLVSGASLVIHNAGRVRAPSSGAFHRANADGAGKVAAAFAAAGVADGRFVLVSSLAATRPRISAYAASKAAGEAVVTAALQGRRLAIVRPPAIYGPRDSATKPLFKAFLRGFAPRFGPADAKLAMIYVDDAARAILAAADAASPAQPVFEVDDGADGYRWSEIGAHAAAAVGGNLTPLPVPGLFVLVAGGIGSVVSSLRLGAPFLTLGKARETLAGDWRPNPTLALLGWSPEVSLKAGFTMTLAWYKDHKN